MSSAQFGDEQFWQSWATPLAQYASASGMTVSLYDSAGVRRLGPLLGTRLAELLASTNFWQAGGAGSAFESPLLAQAVATAGLAQGRLGDLVVFATPLVIELVVRGVLVFGWVLDRFGNSLESGRLAQLIGVDANQLWRTVRAEIPCSPARSSVLVGLLDTLVVAHAAHLVSMRHFEELAKMRDRFLARAAHELRTPLAAISLRADLLLARPLDPVVRTSVEKIAASVKTEAHLIEDLIDAGRTLTGQLRVNMGPVSVAEVVRDCVESIAPVAERKGVRLSSDHDAVAADPIMILGDGTRVRQALLNIITNAIKFTPADGAVTVRLRVTAEQVEVAVTDTGCGMEPGFLARAFEPFVRSDRDNDSGLGLGLTIARQIVDRHGGSLSAESAGADQGSTFRMRLPRAPAA